MRKGLLPKAAVELAGSNNLFAAWIPVEIAPVQSTTLYLLPAGFAEVKSTPGAGKLTVLLILANAGPPKMRGSPVANGRGYTPLHSKLASQSSS
jgi:hypothetical protein